MKNTVGTLFFVYLAFALTGCPELEVCVVDGTTYQLGDSFQSSDGCNTCTCEEGGSVSCTTMGCLDGCDYNGSHYDVGDSFDDADGCNTCTCGEDGVVACTEMYCPQGCEYNGKHYDVGDTFKDIDDCNSCTCMENGGVACTDMACLDGCDYGGQHYDVGDKFDALDGCNTCHCVADNEVACTEMACPPSECGELERFFEPGCGGENGIVEIEPGCYQPCGPNGDAACQSGVCQRTDINPCVCDEFENCCDACGQEYWLCLPIPEEEICLAKSRDPIIVSASRSFGECWGECKYDLTIAQSPLEAMHVCDVVSLSVCGWDQTCPRENQGALTPLGHARARALAAELLDTKLQKTYGCPDCADGGASGFALRRYGQVSSHTYEFSNPPEVLAELDLFSQGLIDALNLCKPNDNIEVASGCVPRKW